jgi:hypothetical protein
MFQGTLIDELMATVERAEQSARQPQARQEQVALQLVVAQEIQRLDKALQGVA